MNGLIKDEDFYIDENGLLIFTEKYLLQRGKCCGNGCRHCPYNYENIEEPKRSKLLALRKGANNEKN